MSEKSALYAEVVREIEALDNMLFFTPYLGERRAILDQLRRHLERGAATPPSVSLDYTQQAIDEREYESRFDD